MAAPKGNQYAVGNSGKPKRWDSPESMQEAIDEYINDLQSRTKQVVTKEGKVVRIDAPVIPTVQGLARILGFTNRQSLLNYEKEAGYEEFFDTIKKTKLNIEEYKAEALINGEGNSTGLIFDLKNNHGHEDKTKSEHTGRDGEPLQFDDLSKLSTDDLRARIALLRATVGRTGTGEA